MKPPRFLRAARTPGERRSAGSSPGPVGVSALPGVAITPKSALGLAAAFACINVVATDVAALPLLAYRKRKGGGRDQVGDLPAAELLGFSPDGETTSMRWRQAIMGHGLGWGNGYGEIERGGDGQPTGLHLLDPGNTRPRRRKSDGRLYYEGPGNATYMADDVIHLAGLGFDGLSGYSPPAMLRRAFELGLAAEGMGAAFYGNSSMPRGALRHPGKLSPQASARLRRDFEAMHRGVDAAFGLAILEEGMEFQQFSINPEDAQFLQVRQFQVLEVCRIYRVPPHKVMDYSQAHLANVEESNLDYIMTTLMPWCEAMEAVCNMKLLTAAQRRQGYYLEHVLAALLRGNMQARASFYEVMERIGVMSPNMIAERENFNPIDEGDVHLVMSNMTTLERLGKAGEPAPAAPEGRNRIAARLNGRGRARVPDGEEGEEDRYNPYHGHDGKFTSGPSGGKGGGHIKVIVPDKKKPAPAGGGGGTDGGKDDGGDAKPAETPAPAPAKAPAQAPAEAAPSKPVAKVKNIIADPQAAKAPAAPGKDLAAASNKEIKSYHDGLSSDWSKELSAKEAGAVQGYSSSLYQQTNGLLRHGTVEGGYSKKDIQSLTGNVDKALNKASLKEGVTVYRGVKDIGALGLDPNKLVGATIRDKAYLSTSLTPKIAERFVSKSKTGAVLRINAPKGSKGASVAGMTNRKDEFEVLFHRDSKIKITGSSRDAKGRLVIDAELSHG